VHEHDLAVRRHRVERVGHRVLPPLPSRDDRDGLAGAAQRRRRRGRELARQHDDEVAHAGMGIEGHEAVLQQRPAVDLEQLLRHGRAETAAGAGGGDDGGDAG
jgi:hypothetical protein